MVMVVFDSSGYWRTCRLKAALNPTSRMSRLTTEASTGRRMKMSVNDIGQPLLVGALSGRHQCLRVVDLDQRAVGQLDLSRRDDLLALLEAGGDGDAILADLA